MVRHSAGHEDGVLSCPIDDHRQAWGPLWCTPVELGRGAALTVKGGQKGFSGSSEKPG